MQEYLSNYTKGRPPVGLVSFKRADLEGRQEIARTAKKPRLRRLLIWQLHDVAATAPQDPRAALPYAELGLELAEKLGEDDLTSWAHSEIGNCLRLLGETNRARCYLDKAVELAKSPY